MKYEKTQKRNPHQIVVNQHIFSRKSIERYANNAGLVEVYLIDKQKVAKVKPDNKVFCARRKWHQRFEQKSAKQIEDKYQQLAESILKGKRGFSDSENSIISDFLILWRVRFTALQAHTGDYETFGTPEYELTKDEEEKLESNHIGYIREDGTIPARQILGARMHSISLKERQVLKKTEWAICEAKEGEFIVPDILLSVKVVPLCPSLILIANESNKVLDRNAVADVNKLAISSSRRFYFGRNLNNCPGYKNR